MTSTKLAHQIIKSFYSFENKFFLTALKNLKSVQEAKISEILGYNDHSKKKCSYEEFSNRFPLSEYANWEQKIGEQRTTGRPLVCKNTVRYEATSGSTHKRKWIPYNKLFLKELNKAASVWMYDLYKQFPKIAEGSHYWSLSWLPKNLRSLTTTDDSQLFPWWQKMLIKQTMTLPAEIAQTETVDSAWFASLCYLVADRDLTLISVWSPTFLLNLLEDIPKKWPQLYECFKLKNWGPYQKELRWLAFPSLNQIPIPSQFTSFCELWPHLSLISCWESSTSKGFAQKVRSQLPQVPLQGKGLWATEGVVTIPYQNLYPLALESHFYEFRCLKTQKIFPSWDLEIGKIVQPIITSGNGLIRYQLNDRLVVNNFLFSTPCFEFLGRQDSIDMVGEKVSHEIADQILRDLRDNFQGIFHALLAIKTPVPTYYLICHIHPNHQGEIAEFLENRLLQIHHYQLARELNQLNKAQCLMVQSEIEINQLLKNSKIIGQNKVETLYYKEDL